MPEEHETNVNPLECRKSFSSPQERTDFNENIRSDTPFGRPSKKQTLTQCLVLEPQNLTKIFDNKEIICNSETLFVKRGLFNKYQHKNDDKIIMKKSDLDLQDYSDNDKTVDNIIRILNKECLNNNDNEFVVNLLNDLYDGMEKENMLNGKINSKTKITILKCLYKYVESQNNKLLLNIARIILAVILIFHIRKIFYHILSNF